MTKLQTALFLHGLGRKDVGNLSVEDAEASHKICGMPLPIHDGRYVYMEEAVEYEDGED